MAIVKYLSDLAEEEHISVRPLWLPAIPAQIFIADLYEKYGIKENDGELNPVIGEYDDPDNQRQNVLTLPLTSGGNAIIYGSTGSGKELMLSSIIYSTITTHDSSEVNFYIVDCGAETLTVFRQAPHVGEVLLANE